jgi:hypothetical protein
MIHIATVHWNTDRWVAVQAAFLRRYVRTDFRVYAWLNDIPNAPVDSFYYTCAEPVGPHAVKLNILADIISASTNRRDDLLIFLDGDAFPVAEIEPLLSRHLPAHKLMAVQRLENNGDIQPHPCFCATTVGFWQELRGDWKEGYKWKDHGGREVTDVGGNLLKQLADKGTDWMPLVRSNTVNLHPLFFGIYGGAIYHHGAGFRIGECRADGATLELEPVDRFFSKLLPGYGRRARRKIWRKIIAANDTLSEQVFERIKQDPQFHQQFL